MRRLAQLKIACDEPRSALLVTHAQIANCNWLTAPPGRASLRFVAGGSCVSSTERCVFDLIEDEYVWLVPTRSCSRTVFRSLCDAAISLSFITSRDYQVAARLYCEMF